ncbi:terminase small subunit, partial [Haemophilus influenzae]
QDMKSESINRLAKKELDKIKIRSRVDVLQQEHRQRHNLTLDNIIADLQEYRDICMGRKPLTITTVVKNAQEGTAQSVNTECFVFEPTGANKALELLGKHLGMFTNKVDVTTDGKPLPTVINVTFSDEPA